MLNIMKKLTGDHRAIKKVTDEIRTRICLKNVIKIFENKLRNYIQENWKTSKNIIVEVDVANVNKEKRCRILKTFAKGIKASKLLYQLGEVYKN